MGAARRGARGARAGVMLACVAIGASGCVRKPYEPHTCPRPDLSGCVVDDVSIVGNAEVDDEDIEGHIATAETQRILGGALEHVPILGLFDRLTVDYERLDPLVLERDLARIERYYRSRGFYEARARAARVMRQPDRTVRVEIAVDEGPPVILRSVSVVAKDWKLPPPPGRRSAADEALIDAMRGVQDARNELEIGKRFEEERYEEIKANVLRAMQNAGFAYATVKGDVAVDLATHEAKVEFELEFGPFCTFGPVTIVGLGELPEAPVRRVIDLRGPFSLDKMQQTEAALVRELGVFAGIDIQPQLSPPGTKRSTVIPVVVTLQPAKLREVKLGIGAQAETTRVESHLIGGWESRNFLGGYRRLTLDARPGIVFWPTRIDTIFDEPPERILPELRLTLGFLQPALPFRTSFDAQIAFNLYQLQPVSAEAARAPDPDEEPNLIGYREFRWNFGFNRTFDVTGRHHVQARLAYTIQRDDPFSYNLDEPPEGYDDLTLSYLSWIVALDYRRGREGRYDPLRPNRGVYVAWQLEKAGGFLGGDADDVKLHPEVRTYVPISRRVTLAFRFSSGLLFPRNYGDALLGEVAGTPGECRDLQILQFRAFFSGGPNSNRGYGFNQIGRHVEATCRSPSATANQTTATGGLTLWESSLELRFPINGSLGGVTFLDAGDVSENEFEFHFERPHLSAGLGLRVDTPVGPFRADVGYRVPCAQIIGEKPEGGCAELPPLERPPLIFGMPIAVSIAIGEAF